VYVSRLVSNRNVCNGVVIMVFVRTTTHKIKKELSICQSSLCLALKSFPVLSQIKPQVPLLKLVEKEKDGGGVMLVVIHLERPNGISHYVSSSVFTWWCPSVNFFKFQPCDLLERGGGYV
jgi:hypothetical protein